MKVATWNIGGCHKFHGLIQDGNTRERTADIPYFAGQLAKLKVDFIALQEPLTPIGANLPTQTEKITKLLSYKHFENHPFTIRKSHIEKDSFLSLGNITSLEAIKTYFHATPNPNLKKLRPDGDTWLTLDYGFLITEVKYKDVKVTIANCVLLPLHYFDRSFTDPEFQNIRSDVTELLSKLGNNPAIILGDFNFGPLKNIYPDVFESGLYSEAFENVETAPGKGQQDHILYSKHWVLVNQNLQKLEADHYLCDAELELIK